MITEDQTDVVAFLASPSTHGGAPVEQIDTHASIVFLAGNRAWKLKRAVRYDYLDFSTAERRKAMCEAEVRINRRTAPELYRGVVAIRRQSDGTLTLASTGTPVDWLVEMGRFDQNYLFDRLATRGELSLDLMAPLATAIARFHAVAESRVDCGGTAGMTWVVDGNALGFAEQGVDLFDAERTRELARATREALEGLASVLDARGTNGFVRRCHGDLHLRNIVLLDGRPVLFDGVEFNDQISCIDVFYDLAFLLMDLWRRQLPAHANSVLNRYLFETNDFEAVALLPLLLSCRAAVRAKTSATAANLERQADRRRTLQSTARDYLSLARDLIETSAPVLIAIGGYSGSGKSTLARRLGPLVGNAPGAVVVRSDEIRKQLCGVDPMDRLASAGYSPEITRRVYETAADRAARIVGAGHVAIVDAVFARPADRMAIECVAAKAGVPFCGLWLDAPESVLVDRAVARQLDASDADAHVIRQQHIDGAGAIEWPRIDASTTSAAVRMLAVAILRNRVPGDVRFRETA